MDTKTSAIFATAKDAAVYLSAKDARNGYPKLEGVPGGADPTGRRHMYPSQRMTESLESIVAATDGTAFALTLDDAIPLGKGVKGSLDAAKWAAAAAAEVLPAGAKPVDEKAIAK
jgi:hypothetical protein